MIRKKAGYENVSVKVLKVEDGMDEAESFANQAKSEKANLISNAKLWDLLGESLGVKKIEDADIPLAVIATDITNGDKVVLDEGSVAKAVLLL